MNQQYEPHKFYERSIDGKVPDSCALCSASRHAAIHVVPVPGVSVTPSGLLPDSGVRVSFGAGMASREADPSKPAHDGLSPYAMHRLSLLMTKADDKYKDVGGKRNWEKGMPVTRYLRAILGHTFAYMCRDTSEDHLASIMWNAMCLAHHEVVGTVSGDPAIPGKTFTEIDDRPKYDPALGVVPPVK